MSLKELCVGSCLSSGAAVCCDSDGSWNLQETVPGGPVLPHHLGGMGMGWMWLQVVFRLLGQLWLLSKMHSGLAHNMCSC